MTVTTSTIDGTLLITIDRPPVNALDVDTILALQRTFALAAQDAPGNGVVLTGGGQVFSAGVDTRAFAGYGSEQRHTLVHAITAMVAELLRIAVPVVAAVNGHALGGGFVLMLGCDHRIATDADTAKLGMTEAQAGIPFPAGPLEIMRHELAPELLRRLTLTSAVLGGRELLDAGVLDEISPPDELSSRAVTMAKRMAAQPAFRAVKQQIRGGLRERLAALAAKRQDPFIADFG